MQTGLLSVPSQYITVFWNFLVFVGRTRNLKGDKIGVARRSVYYKPGRATPKVDPAFAKPIKAMIEEEPSFGYRTAANLIGFNKNKVQRIFKLNGWHVRKRARKPTTRNTNNRRLDPLLQYPQTPPGPRHENTSRGLQISSITCAESDGSLQFVMDKHNPVYAMDITFIEIALGFVNLAAVVDWLGRRVLFAAL